MNCKRDQLAWVVVPRQYRGTGLEQLNNHVVKTIQLAPGFPEPTWQVTPRQTVKFARDAVDQEGRLIRPGEERWTDTLPDSFLRPFDPDSTPKDELESRELENAA